MRRQERGRRKRLGSGEPAPDSPPGRSPDTVVNARGDVYSRNDAIEALRQFDREDRESEQEGRTRDAMKALFGDDSPEAMLKAFEEGGVWRQGRSPHNRKDADLRIRIHWPDTPH